ncbi:PTS fructose transporter subunit IIBC [Xanthomonas axonopodis]|uniref:protein-N(pi)-phosphohistidine--D-fructose phosphotransferase n=1 Tax=Xanthomonas axonopodis TaxID=53413 RepID=A0A0P6VTM4_9XANT|nr:fructose-specific PTS transporter subunit EIIC [Xanthomonas axonopodis]KPL49994.1 PTS fructose transporter subunit IIBC [Xanthomonas axonopodis]
MFSSIVVIAAGERSTEAVLAAEALRRAATAAGRRVTIEIRSDQGVLGALPGELASTAAQVLVVGDAEADTTRFGDAQLVRLSLGAVLDDPAAAIGRLAEPAAPAAASSPNGTDNGSKRIVAITSCPTGIAHTFMAAEGLQQAAKKLGYQMRVETQGSVGAQDALTDNEIHAAEVVIIAADREVDLARFGGKRVFKSGTKPAINDGPALINKALAEASVHGAATSATATGTAASATTNKGSSRTGAYRHLMTGVSFMLPFVTAGGLLIALAFALGGIYAGDDAHQGTLAWSLFQIGAKAGFTLMVPALAGYIAYSIADRPGIAPGMIGGLVAANLNAGFLGGIIAGFIAGYGVAALNRYIRLPRNLEGLKPVLILPVLGTLLVGLAMMYVFGQPVADLLAWLTAWLRGMQGSSALLLGLLLGGMMAFDMGGPVNKAAYAFSTGLIASQVYTPMAAAMVAGMTPPLGIALATWVFRNRFTAEERGSATAAGVLGLAFVTEGAIPYAARDPLRTIPALVIGSAVAGAISMTAGAELKAPHGGIFVLLIPNAVTHLLNYVLALVVGVVVTAIALRLLKKPVTDVVA